MRPSIHARPMASIPRRRSNRSWRGCSTATWRRSRRVRSSIRRHSSAAHPEIAERLRSCLAVLRVASRVEGECRHRRGRVDPALDNRLGDFRILRMIGRGGMGIVFEAEQVSLHRRVALKVLPFAAALDPQQLRRFQIEAQAAARLHHTNIVPIFSVGCERGVHYYAMQYIKGQTLAALIGDLRRLAGLERRDVTA